MLSTELLAYYRRISQATLTVVDLETTGCRPPLHRVIEVSVLQASLKDGIHEQRTHLLNPQVRVPAPITQFTGITQAMVTQSSLSVEVWPEYLPLLSSGILTAHNLAFDYAFLRSEFNFVQVPFVRSEDEQFCTLQLSRLMLSDLPSRSLPYLVQHFGFDGGRSHRAAADAIACWLLAERLLTEIQSEADDRLLERFGQQWLPLKYAAAILQVSSRQARKWIQEAGVEAHRVGRYHTPMYQRHAIEQIYRDRYPSTQLSWIDQIVTEP